MKDSLRTLPDDPAEVRFQLRLARVQVAQSAKALRAEVERSVHWREWVRREPKLCLLGAFTLGLCIGIRR
jgi:hypothetical protein